MNEMSSLKDIISQKNEELNLLNRQQTENQNTILKDLNDKLHIKDKECQTL